MAKSIIIVNNNLHIGGVQKSLIDFLKANSKDYDITLCLFADIGEYLSEVPNDVKIISTTSLFHLFGISLNESKASLKLFFLRAFFAFMFKIFGRKLTMTIILRSQQVFVKPYDYAISYLHNAGQKSFYGGCNEFVIHKIQAQQKIAFIHCDYRNSGANNSYNNKLYQYFDKIATCSLGCLKSFLSVLPFLESRTCVVNNFHDFENIDILSRKDTLTYDKNYINIVIIARLSAEKAIDRAIYSMDYCLRRGAKVKLHIIGGGILYENLLKLSKSLNIENSIYFYGFSNNPYRFLRNADLLLITSYHEAAPLVVDEARSLNVPILSVETTSSNDMILSTKSGFVCENNLEALQSLLYNIVKDRQLLTLVKESMKECAMNNDLAKSQLIDLLNNECL